MGLHGLREDLSVRPALAIQKYDTFPNIDGFVELTERDKTKTETDTPISRLFVQVRYLSKTDPPKVRIDRQLIASANINPDTPLILVAVDPWGHEAYWEEVLPERDCLTVTFDREKIIDEGHTDYLKEWRRLCENRRFVITQPDEYPETLKASWQAVAKKCPEIRHLQSFIDELNQLTDRALLAAKERLVQDCWKIGVAFSDFTESSSIYALYGIPRGQSDPLVKQLTEGMARELKAQGCRFIYHPRFNPFTEDPEAYAGWRAMKMVAEVVRGKMLNWRGDRFIAREVISSLGEIFTPTENGARVDSCSIPELRKRIPTQPPPEDFYGERSPIADLKAMAERATNIGEISMQYTLNRLGSYTGMFADADIYLTEIGETEVENPYRLHHYRRYPDEYDWTRYSDEDIDHDVRVFLEQVPKVFNHLMEKNFPGLPDEYFLFRNRPIIAAYRHTPPVDFIRRGEEGPWLKSAFLRGSEASGFSIKVIDVTKEPDAALLLDQPNRLGLKFDGQTYDRWCPSHLHLSKLILGETPVLQYAYDLLAKQLGKYFQTTFRFTNNEVSCIKTQ